jgi:hypothetical protein
MLKINKTYTTLISICLGVFFMISGIGKMLDSSSFVVLVNNYGLTKLSIFAPLIIILEIYLGLNLVLLTDIKKTSYALLFLLSLFTLAYTYAFLFKGIKDCGCFGTLNTSHIPSSLTFVRNIFLILLIIILIVNHNNIVTLHTNWKSYLIYLVIFISSFITGNTSERFSLKSGVKYKSDPRNLIGKNINETPVKFLSLNTKSQLVFILSPSCPHCINSIENIEKIFEKHLADSSVVYFSTRNNFDSLNYVDSNISIKWGDTDNLKKISTVYPTTIFIKNDTIKNVILGVVPSYINLIKIIY